MREDVPHGSTYRSRPELLKCIKPSRFRSNETDLLSTNPNHSDLDPNDHTIAVHNTCLLKSFVALSNSDSTLNQLKYHNIVNTAKRVDPWSQVTLPTSLRSLTFGHEFNQSLQHVNFPDDLQSMTDWGSFWKGVKRANVHEIGGGPTQFEPIAHL